MKNKIFNTSFLFVSLIIISGCKRVTDADSNTQSTDRYLCRCETPLGGYMRASKLGDCNCESSASVIGCVLRIVCSSDAEYSKNEIESYIGDKQKWEELIDFMKTQDDPIAQNIAKKAKDVYEKGNKDANNSEVLILLEELNADVEKLSAMTKMKLKMFL
ncbi:MAG: hypothetical protein IPP49_17585 [Saprospiraceae bacterium]|nr:hypothetical protein [Saprospiraceae bacterium]